MDIPLVSKRPPPNVLLETLGAWSKRCSHFKMFWFFILSVAQAVPLLYTAHSSSGRVPGWSIPPGEENVTLHAHLTNGSHTLYFDYTDVVFHDWHACFVFRRPKILLGIFEGCDEFEVVASANDVNRFLSNPLIHSSVLRYPSDSILTLSVHGKSFQTRIRTTMHQSPRLNETDGSILLI
jgi:hypothetical protein